MDEQSSARECLQPSRNRSDTRHAHFPHDSLNPLPPSLLGSPSVEAPGWCGHRPTLGLHYLPQEPLQDIGLSSGPFLHVSMTVPSGSPPLPLLFCVPVILLSSQAVVLLYMSGMPMSLRATGQLLFILHVPAEILPVMPSCLVLLGLYCHCTYSPPLQHSPCCIETMSWFILHVSLPTKL